MNATAQHARKLAIASNLYIITATRPEVAHIADREVLGTMADQVHAATATYAAEAGLTFEAALVDINREAMKIFEGN